MPRVITREQVKTQLGITDVILDSQIDAKLPIIDAKVKAITGRSWNDRIIGNITDGSTYVEVFSYGYTQPRGRQYYDNLVDYIEVGQQISGEGMVSDAYIVDVWKLGTLTSDVYPQIELDQAATETKNGATLFLGFPIAYHDIVAKGVQWLINNTNQTITDNTWTRKSMGPISVSKSDADNKLDSKSGMPLWFVKGLPRYMRA